MPDTAPTALPCKTIHRTVQALTPEAFAPFGQIIAPTPDGRLFGSEDAQLDISRGTPRFYIMALKGRPTAFHHLARHMRVTQCLAACSGKPWLMGVARPDDPDDPKAKPDPAGIVVFHVPGTLGIKLHRSTWHAGPLFSGPAANFFNLELSDTNQSDYHPVYLDKEFGIEIQPVGPLADI